LKDYLLWFDSLRMTDVDRVGGKNASLGEMISQLAGLNVNVPNGFATTADAYRDFLEESGLAERIDQALEGLDIEDVDALAKAGQQIREWISAAELPQRLRDEIAKAYEKLSGEAGGQASFAIRSSATAEDLPDASFAGQQETFLNVRGLEQVVQAVREVYASLFNDRAIAYRVHHGFEHKQVALSAGVQRMVRSDIGASGVMFTLDTESGYRDAIFITGAWGLGETVVQGQVNPDEFYVHKPLLREDKRPILRRNLGSKAVRMVYTGESGVGQSTRTEEVPLAEQQRFCIDDDDVLELARQAMTIEDHYQRPMDIEWAKDGETGGLFIVQARPETVKSRGKHTVLERYELNSRGEILSTGRSIGQRIGAGPARVIDDVK